MLAHTFDKTVVSDALARAAANEAKALRKLQEHQDAKRLWHLVQINQPQFALAKGQLDLAGYPLYAPLQRNVILPPAAKLSLAQRKNRHLFGREKLTPYFGAYRFVRFDAGFDPWHDLFKLVGVHGIGCKGNLPVAMPDVLIDKLKAKEQMGAIPADAPVKALFYSVGEEVKINTGPFVGFTGKVERIDESGRIRLLLELFACMTPTDLTADDVDKITK